MKNLDALILALFRVVAPKTERDEWRSPRGWFLWELARHKLEISSSTLDRWCSEGVPASRQQDLDEVVSTIYRKAHAIRQAELQAVRAIVSTQHRERT